MYIPGELTSRHLLVLIALLLISCTDFNNDSTTNQEVEIEPVAEIIYEPSPEPNPWGLIEQFARTEHQRIRRNQNMSVILRSKGLTHGDVHNITMASRGVFDLRRIVVGNQLVFFYQEEDELQYFVYEHNTTDYVLFDLSGETPTVRLEQKDVDVQVNYMEGVITSSLYQTLRDNGMDGAMAYRMADVFAWQVDFYRIQRGDSFRVLYEEEFVDGQSIGVRSILASEFTHRNHTYSAYLFPQNGIPDYFDSEGNALRGEFLRAPLEYSRISSGFTNRRFHPVLRRNMPHHGTDYAAPTGTPIRAVGDGLITIASTDRNNGNWVKIRHNSVYESGYLHMTRFANGIRRGSEVKQGQIIGYVGQTGLATGPHLCYRFWVNGQPADPRRIELPPSEPIDDLLREEFEERLFRLASIMQRMKMDYDYEYLLAAFDKDEDPTEETELSLTL